MSEAEKSDKITITVQLDYEDRGALAFLARKLNMPENEVVRFCLVNTAEFQRYIDMGYQISARVQSVYGATHSYTFEWPTQKEGK